MDPDSKQQPEMLTHLFELSGIINSDLHVNSVLSRIIKVAMEVTNSEAASVFLLNETREELVLTTPAGPAEEVIRGVSFPKSEGIAGWVATQEKALIVNDVTKDDRFRGDFDPGFFETKSLMCVPLFDQTKRIIGVLQTVNKKEDGIYHEREIPVFQALANQAAVALGNAKLHEDREKLLGEIHHRVKNNMAVISAFAQIEAMSEKDDDLRQKLLKNVARIAGMSAVHEQLYKSDSFQDVRFVENVEQLIYKTVDTLEKEIDFELYSESNDILLNINQAIPCSLLIVEIIMHIISDFGNDSVPPFSKVEIRENRADDALKVVITCRNNNDAEEPAVLSNQLTQMLASQCHAKLSFKSKKEIAKITIEIEKTAMRGSGNYAM
jgi:two-component sensor histidine kinase